MVHELLERLDTSRPLELLTFSVKLHPQSGIVVKWKENNMWLKKQKMNNSVLDISNIFPKIFSIGQLQYINIKAAPIYTF